MSLPSPQVIRTIALQYGYQERKAEASSTLFFKGSATAQNHGDHPTLINVFYTTGGIMTKLYHPTSGYNELWRTDAYDSAASIAAIFANPRVHTGRGYRSANNSARGCTKCGLQKYRGDYSKNQWRKGLGEAKCISCVQQGQQQQGGEGGGRGGVGGNEHLLSGEIHWETITDAITCDANGCSKLSPAIRCPSCCMAYYCSEACRRRHHEEHSQDCMDIEQFRNQFRMSNSDPNLNYGLCNARPSTISQKRGHAMTTLVAGIQTVEALLLQAEAIHQADGNWEQAVAIYTEILRKSYEVEHDQLATPPQWRQVWMGLSRCYYELGIYDKAIAAGTAALEMNRHFPHVHKYIALAHEAKGDHVLAIKTMKNAVLYEAPWSAETVHSNKEMLRKIANNNE